MVVIQSLMDNLCRCICATSIPACGEMPFGGGSSGQSHTASVEDASLEQAQIDAKMAERSHLSEHARERNCGTPFSASMAAGLSTAESNNGGAAANAKAAVSDMAARLRGSLECATTDSLFRNKGSAAAEQGVPAAVSSDVSSNSSGINNGSSPARRGPSDHRETRQTNSVETVEDREAKEALAEARKEAGRQSGRKKAQSSMARSQNRATKRKADIFRSRNNPAAPTPAQAAAAAVADAALADDENDPAADDETDDEIVGLRHRRRGAGSIFNCADDSPSSGGRSKATSLGRMMLCFASPIRGSDEDDEAQAGGCHAPCAPIQHIDVDSSPPRRGRKAARTDGSDGDFSSSAARSSAQAPSQAAAKRDSHVRTIADDIEELEAMQAERDRIEELERKEEALRNGEPIEMDHHRRSGDGCASHDEMTLATNADETITSTLYFDAKLGEVVEKDNSAPRPPMPLFQQFKVDVDEQNDDEIRKIVRSGSHKFSIMQMWKQSSPIQDGGGAPVLKATPTARDVVGALGIQEVSHGHGSHNQRTPAPPASPPQSARRHHQRGPPVVRQVTPPEREASARFASAPRAPMLVDGGGAERLGANPRPGQQGMSLDFSGDTSSSSSRDSSSRQRRSQHQVVSAEV